MNQSEETLTKKEVAEFMLAEYNTLRDLRQCVVSVGESRLNFFLATVSGTVVALALIGQVTGYEDIKPFISGITIFGLLLLGLNVHVRMVERGMSVTVYTRGMNRIRRYFVESDRSIKDYLILPITDNKPSFAIVGSLLRSAVFIDIAPAVAIINSTVASAGTVILGRMCFYLPIQWASVIGAFVFIAFFMAQTFYHMARIKEMQSLTSVHFPQAKLDRTLSSDVVYTPEKERGKPDHIIQKQDGTL